MSDDDAKQVSKEPVVSNAPRQSGGNLLTLVILFSMIGAVTTATLILLDPFAESPDSHVTQWPEYRHHEDFQRNASNCDEAVANMTILSEALVAYREDFGGNLNWPANLDELEYAGLLREDFRRSGVLSDKPIVYNPEMPMGHDPSRWVIAHDTEIGWQRRMNSRYATKSPRASVVILGDGTVKLLKGDELTNYGGLNVDMDT